MSESDSLFATLRQAAEPDVADAVEQLVRDAPDHALCRINVLDFAGSAKLDEERVITGLLHATRLGLFDLLWNILCPSCGGVIETNPTLKTITRPEYRCAFCAAGYEPILDEVVEVTFTVNPRLREIASHHPETLPLLDYYRQIFWSSGIDLPPHEILAKVMEEVTLETVELPPGEGDPVPPATFGPGDRVRSGDALRAVYRGQRRDHTRAAKPHDATRQERRSARPSNAPPWAAPAQH